MKQPPIRKSLGQHFLNDRRILERIVDTLDLSGTETVIEIGPGRGGLTDVLAPRCGRLIAIEIDRALAARLRERYAGRESVTILEADVLKVNLGETAGGPFRLVGNVPYYITTPILFHALERPRPERAVYLVQREVADRIVAAPGSKEYGALSVNVQSVAIPRLLFRVAPGSFQPPPKVESAVVRIDPRPTPVITPDEEPVFRRFVQDVFGMRRKQLQRILRCCGACRVRRSTRRFSRAASSRAHVPRRLHPSSLLRCFAPRRESNHRPARSNATDTDKAQTTSFFDCRSGRHEWLSNPSCQKKRLRRSSVSVRLCRSVVDRFHSHSRFVSAKLRPSSSIAMLTVFTATSGGACS